MFKTTLIATKYLFVDIFLNGIVIGDINLVQVDGIENVGPHVMVILYVLLKTLQEKMLCFNSRKSIKQKLWDRASTILNVCS